MNKRYLLIGSTGMLGKAIYEAAKSKGHEIIGIARSDADINIDISDNGALVNTLYSVKPDIIINTAAIVDLEYCETHPTQAYLINTRPSAFLTDYCIKNRTYLIHISTDHFFSGDGNAKHNENSAITLLNEYAKTKYLAEKLVEMNLKFLIIRTNIVGFKDSIKTQSFVEWIIESVKTKKVIKLFEDYYTSSIDVYSFSNIVLQLADIGVIGLLNVGSREVSSKKDFILRFASQFNFESFSTITGSVRELAGPRRSESLGLDVSKVEKILGYRMPTLDEVICNLYNEYKRREML